MKIAVVTLTRDRLEYTKRSFASLAEKAGCPFSHYVIDNGSEDGTVRWLFAERSAGRVASLSLHAENQGIGEGWRWGADLALYGKADVVVKLDNDCLLKSDRLLFHLAAIAEALAARGERWILSPRVEGIVNQPARQGEAFVGTSSVRDGYAVEERTWRIGETAMVGGLFLAAPAELYRDYPWPTDLPKAQGWDSAFCAWARARGWRTGYVEDLVVEHMDTTEGQLRRFPAYHARKMRELGRHEEAERSERLAREQEGVRP